MSDDLQLATFRTLLDRLTGIEKKIDSMLEAMPHIEEPEDWSGTITPEMRKKIV
jgi:hypothetical protein